MQDGKRITVTNLADVLDISYVVYLIYIICVIHILDIKNWSYGMLRKISLKIIEKKEEI